MDLLLVRRQKRQNDMKNEYAVMGHPVHHSLSPIIHQLFAKQCHRLLKYEKIQIDLVNFEQQVLNFFKLGGKGLNITLPCKQRAYTLADKTTLRCQKAGSANTLWYDGRALWADNTDGLGLMRDLQRYITVAGMRILILGAGGAARGILDPLLQANPLELVIVNRTIQKAHMLSREFSPAISCSLSELNGVFDLVINATSASLSETKLVLPVAHFIPSTFFYDLAYSTLTDTPFIAWAREQGCLAADGLGMLVEQAAEAFFIWHGIMPKTIPVLNYLRRSF